MGAPGSRISNILLGFGAFVQQERCRRERWRTVLSGALQRWVYKDEL
jgi:hypothetical protein